MSLSVLALVFSLFAQSSFAAEEIQKEEIKWAMKIGQIAPDFTLKSHSKENIRLNELRGNYVLISFWATWSGASIKLIKQFENIHQKYSDQGFRFISISIDPLKSENTLDKLQPEHFPLLDYDSKVSRLYGVETIPTIILLDRSGTVLMALKGFDPRYHDLVENKIDNLLSQDINQ